MAFALNILALIMVLGLCWAAMMWLPGRFHGHGDTVMIDDFDRVDFVDSRVGHLGDEAPCSLCAGVGASHERGRLQPCPECEGTGLLY